MREEERNAHVRERKKMKKRGRVREMKYIKEISHVHEKFCVVRTPKGEGEWRG